MSKPAGHERRSVSDRLFRALQDVRGLKMSAPLRAGYEVSKRAGGHTVVFRHLVPTSAGLPPGRSPFDFRNVPASVRDRTVTAADRIVEGSIELFGQALSLGDPPDWHSVIHTEGKWPATDWWRIDLRSDDRLGDVKWVWELGRHRHLVILARAAYLETSNDRYLEVLNQHLESWMSTSPPELGVHWYSNLEIALRAASWLQILALVGDRLQQEVRSGMWRRLHHSARHLIADLPYTVSTMRNNHLLGDAFGLIALGSAFGGRTGNRWYAIGNRIFNQQLARQMHPNGSMIEDSVSYHRFVLEMLSMRVILGGASDEVYESMRAAAQFLARLGVLDGPVPQYGDWDEGRVFAVADDPTDLAGTVRLALALAGDGAPQDWRDAYDEVAWFAGEGTPVPPAGAETDGTDIGAGIARVASGPFTVWLKGGCAPSHGHADLSSVAISHGGKLLIGDPGTGTYSGPIEMRNYFRSSAAHDVSRVEGIDQLEPHRVFRWVHQASGTIGDPIRIGDTVIMWTVHDAYTRLSPPRRIARVVAVSRDSVEVIDYVEGPPVSVDLALPLHPQTTWNPGASTIELGDQAFHIALPPGDVTTVLGVEAPYGGWWSETYGIVKPSPVIQARCDSGQRVRWIIETASGSESDVGAEGPGALAVSILFDETSTRLRVEADGHTSLRSI